MPENVSINGVWHPKENCELIRGSWRVKQPKVEETIPQKAKELLEPKNEVAEEIKEIEKIEEEVKEEPKKVIKRRKRKPGRPKRKK